MVVRRLIGDAFRFLIGQNGNIDLMKACLGCKHDHPNHCDHLAILVNKGTGEMALTVQGALQRPDCQVAQILSATALKV